MAILLRSSNLVLHLSTLLLFLVSCEGRPSEPSFTSFFTSPTSFRVEWEEPTLDPGATVKGYRLHYRLGNGKMVKLKVEATAGRSYDIEDLAEPCGDYLVRMSTASSKGMSRYSSFSQIDRVYSGPEDLHVVSSSLSASVTWSPPPTGFCISGYQLKYGPNENELASMDLPAALSRYLLLDLRGDTSYLVILVAVANGETSEEAVHQWYQAGVPTAPANLRADPASPTSAIVMWRPTSSSVIRYDYLFGPSGYPDGKLTTGSAEPGNMLVELTDLEAAEEYVFRVKSVSSVGQSEAASVTWTQPAPVPIAPPSKPVPAAPARVNVDITSAETATISWSPPEGEVEVIGYIVGFGLTGTAFEDLTQFSVEPGDTEEELDGLKAGSAYVVSVLAYNDVGDGEANSIEWLQDAPLEPPRVPSPPEGVLTYTSSPTTIVVRWAVTPAVAAEGTEGFRVTYGRDRSASDGGSLEAGPEEDSTEIGHLQPDTFYYLRIYKFNLAGQSEAVSRSLQTMSPPPEMPRGSEAAGRCAQQRRCSQQFGAPRPHGDSDGGGDVCPRIRRYLNCLLRLQQACIEEATYRRRVADVRTMFLTEGCNRNSGSPPNTGAQGPVSVPEVIPTPTSLSATLLSPTKALISWVDPTLGDSEVATDDRFYNLLYRSPPQSQFLEVRTPNTSYTADFLLPGVQFEFKVQLVLGSQRRSEDSEAVFVTSRDPSKGAQPARFTVTQVIVAGPTTAKAILNWLPPPDRHDVMEYRIEYTDSAEFRDPAAVWERLSVDGHKMTAVLDGLRTDQEYHARITAVFGSGEAGPTLSSPAAFSTPVVPPSSKTSKQCRESEMEAVTRRVNFLWDEVADGVQRPPLIGVPIPFCDDEFGVEECHGLFCFCVPGSKPPALRDAQCTSDEPPCRREYNAARQSLDEARLTGKPAIAAQLPHCRSDGLYQPKQCSGTMCYCVTENGAHTGEEAPMWEANRLRCV